MDFKFEKLDIPDVILITPEVFSDERGFFMEIYKKSVFDEAGIKEDFIQENYSSSKKNVLRGLHYQIYPKQQVKLVRCTRGEIFDVAVDIRKGSPSFGKWVAANLTEENKKMVFIPAGFAHGYLVLSEKAEVVYKLGTEYSREHERGIFYKDPTIKIEWPISATPILSKKDKKLPLLQEAEINFRF